MIIAIAKPDKTLVVHGLEVALPAGVRALRIDTDRGTAHVEYDGSVMMKVKVRDHAAEDALTEAARAAGEPEPETPIYKTEDVPKTVELVADLAPFQGIVDALRRL
jgi:hypothetical protein